MRTGLLTLLIVASMSMTTSCQAGWILDRIRKHQAEPPRHFPKIAADPTPTRAGCPHNTHAHAKPSIGPAYSAGYVGGGSLFARHGRCRKTTKGTWGLDYDGHLLRRRNFLHWFRKPNCQGGAGAYKTDGPHVPDPIAHLEI